MSVILSLQRFAAIGEATGVLGSPLGAAKDRDLPGATVDSVVAVARRTSPQLATAALEADAPRHKVGAAGARPDLMVTLQAWDVNGRGVELSDQQDMVKAEIEAAAAAAHVARRESEPKSAAARLNGLIGHDARAPRAVPNGFRPLKSNLTQDSIQALARAANPVLAATDAQVRSASRAKELTDPNDCPEVAVGANFVQRPTGDNSGQFLTGFKVPLQYEAKDAEQCAASSKLGAAQARNDAIRIRLDGDVAEVRFRLEAARKPIPIFERRQPPPARLLVKAAGSGFQAEPTDLAAVLEAERRLPTIELELLRLKVEEQVKYAEFKRLAGGSR